jgi:nucleoside-diphosphate-sugar epimerase
VKLRGSTDTGELARGPGVKVLVTGATGFVGRALVGRLVGDGRWTVRATVRRDDAALPAGIECAAADLDPGTNWETALAGINTVVHLAGRVHVMRDAEADPLVEFRRINVAGTLNLARQAASAHVRRFVYMSSVKVHGESGTYSETDPPAPEDAYGISKHEAELGLRRIAAETAMEAVIIRAPLVYGAHARANFRTLVRAIRLGIPLPFGAVNNRRSLIALDNLVDFIVTCIEHPAAANETFLVCDGEDISTADLITRLARAMHRPARLIPVPPDVLSGAASLVGKRDVARRLLGSLSVDITKARQRLGWTPAVSVDEGLRRAVADWT